MESHCRTRKKKKKIEGKVVVVAVILVSCCQFKLESARLASNGWRGVQEGPEAEIEGGDVGGEEEEEEGRGR